MLSHTGTANLKGQLSSDYDLVPIAALKYKADTILRGPAKNLEAELNEVVYTDENSQVSPLLLCTVRILNVCLK